MNTEKKPFALIIFGPTGVGKTDLSLEIARHYDSEIINGDMGQFYTPLSIGTAKPDWKNDPVPHHLFDIVDEPRNITVYDYRRMLIEKVNEIWGRGKLPIIVGGSGFYLKSLFFPPSGTATPSDFLPQVSDDELWGRLNDIDPERSAHIAPRDYYRLRRALAIWHTTGKSPSSCQPEFDLPFRFLLLYVSRDKDDLYQRINERTHVMVRDGWLDEVRQLKGTPWEAFLYEKKLIGYDVLFDYLCHEPSELALDRAVELIQQRTRQYAKRQNTFWKGLERQLNAAVEACFHGLNVGEAQLINLTLYDRALYITQVLKRLVVLIG